MQTKPRPLFVGKNESTLKNNYFNKIFIMDARLTKLKIGKSGERNKNNEIAILLEF